jgi:hypothetical protein
MVEEKQGSKGDEDPGPTDSGFSDIERDGEIEHNDAR